MIKNNNRWIMIHRLLFCWKEKTQAGVCVTTIENLKLGVN